MWSSFFCFPYEILLLGKSSSLFLLFVFLQTNQHSSFLNFIVYVPLIADTWFSKSVFTEPQACFLESFQSYKLQLLF